MNKTYIAVCVVIVFLVGGLLLVSKQKATRLEESKIAQDKAAMTQKENEAKMTKDADVGEKMVKEESPAMDKSSKSRYVVYSKSALDNAVKNRRVLFFYANWCSTCRPTDADLTSKVDKIPADVTIIRVNYNDTDTDQEEKDLAKKYGITYQHTFVQIDTNGEVVAEWNGGQTDELIDNIK